jgi:hypothetical protein
MTWLRPDASGSGLAVCQDSSPGQVAVAGVKNRSLLRYALMSQTYHGEAKAEPDRLQ